MGIVMDMLRWMESDCSGQRKNVSTMILTAGFHSVI